MSAQQSTRGTAATTRLRKVECPTCGYVVRVSRKWIAAGLPVCPCGAAMSCADVDDARLDPAVSDLIAEHEATEFAARELAAAKRSRKGGVRDLALCQGCRRIIAHRNAVCGSCGHENSAMTGPWARSTAGAAMAF